MVYIKQIIIQGFKSYKDQIVIEPFSPKHNVIVGRNGSGKSNFFAAIRFVLSDAYTQMGREERQALLHEGSGSAVMSAYVEIIFDNSDERFPTGKDELILRRSIGAKKDEYSLDRKSATKSDVMNLLESAGFSRSNPYYIVPQGRVTTLTNMKDPERLNLLKEVAGTQVYEARRTESIRIMGETDSRRAKIDDLLSSIRERLQELEEEKEELNAYQAKDRERRCLEYTIYHREQEEINRALDSLEEQRLEGVDETDSNRDRFLQGEKGLSQIDDEIKGIRQRLELLRVDKNQYEDERRDMAKERANVELEIKNMTDGRSAASNARTRHEGDLQHVQSAIQQKENQLAKIVPQYDQARTKERAVKSQLDDAESTRQRLFAKQGRSAKFKTRNERDSWLSGEISQVNVALATRKAVAMQTKEEIQELEKGIQDLSEEISKMRKRHDNRTIDMQSVGEDVHQAKNVRDRLMDQRKELWREQARLDSVMRNSRQELESSERFLSHLMSHNTSRGLAAVRRIKQNQNLDGAHGPLSELFTVSGKYKTAVEVAAGESLFHYVVDTDDTATRILEILNKEKAGRVTFMPLNRLRPSIPAMPKANDAIEMISRLNYDPKYEKAFQQVFGKTIISPNLQIASQYARSHGVTGITPSGDRSDKKGALTGGYHDPRASRMDAVQNLSKRRNDFEANRAREDDISRELERKDQEITRAHSEIQKADHKQQQRESSFSVLQREIQSRSADLQDKKSVLESKKIAKDNVETAANDLAEQQAAYESERLTDFKKALSAQEEQTLNNLSNSLPSLRKQYLELSSSRAEVEAQKSTLEVELNENLKPHLDRLMGQELEADGSGTDLRLKERQKDMKRVNKAVEDIEKKLASCEGSIDEASRELSQINETRASKQREQEEIARAIEKFQKKMEKGMAKRLLLTEKAAEASRNVRDLGVLPEEAFSKYTKIPSDQAIKKLRAANEALKAYSHVNKKAFEQYSNFTRQRDVLIKRRQELDTSQRSIRELIEVLDQRKDEAIERTFKQVSKEFASIFSRLVPAGRGRLIIQRKSDARVPDEASDSDEEVEEHGVENYTGVGIAVSFNSKHDEQQRIQQLSGGQKSLCALALVFAIQQCDPAPFYLFDEIDANLDAQYRTAVADLLRQISDGGQFICTTFRPEMVHVAEKCYGVTYSSKNKTSRVDVVEREDALGFVEGQISGA